MRRTPQTACPWPPPWPQRMQTAGMTGEGGGGGRAGSDDDGCTRIRHLRNQNTPSQESGGSKQAKGERQQRIIKEAIGWVSCFMIKCTAAWEPLVQPLAQNLDFQTPRARALALNCASVCATTASLRAVPLATRPICVRGQARGDPMRVRGWVVCAPPPPLSTASVRVG